MTPVATLSPEVDAILHVLVRNPSLRDQAFDRLGFEPSMVPAPWTAIAEYLMLNPDADGESLMYQADSGPLAAVKPSLFTWLTKDCPVEPGQLVATSIARLRIVRLEDEARRLDLALKEADRSADPAAQRRLFTDRMGVAQQIRDLRQTVDRAPVEPDPARP